MIILSIADPNYLAQLARAHCVNEADVVGKSLCEPVGLTLFWNTNSMLSLTFF